MAVIALSYQMDERYNEISELLRIQLSNKIHFTHYGFGIEPAWTLAICLAENLREKDYGRLKGELANWDDKERQGLIKYLDDFPKRIEILTKGKGS